MEKKINKFPNHVNLFLTAMKLFWHTVDQMIFKRVLLDVYGHSSKSHLLRR